MDIRRFLLDLGIRYKLIVAFSSILLLTVILVIVAINTSNNILEYTEINEKMDRLTLQILELKLAEKNFVEVGFKRDNFLTKGQSEDILHFEQNYIEMRTYLKQLKENHLLYYENIQEKLGAIETNLNNYNEDFGKLIEVLKDRGFKDYGVEGDLRDAIHRVEDTDFDYDKATMLMLRRHEKDFFLRKDLNYPKKFNQSIDLFIRKISEKKGAKSPRFLATQEKILKDLENYKNQFNYIVSLEQEIGLSNDSGLKGKIAATTSLIFPQITELSEVIKSLNRKLIDYRIIILFVLFFIQFLLGLILVLFYSNLLTRAITEIKNSMVSLSNGAFPNKLAIRTQDELGQTKIALNNLVDRIRTATNFAYELGHGKLKAKYDERYSNDVLAKSILALQDQLLLAEAEQQQINWVNQGIAHFNEILKDEPENVKTFGVNILNNLTNYMNVSQGALFLTQTEVAEEEIIYLERIATYAYGRKKFVRQKIEVGENLLGQCVLEKRTIHLQNLPEDYPHISSGLGESKPASVLIVPLKVREEVMAVLELSSFTEIKAHEISFVEKLSETLANVLLSRKISDQTHELLEESQNKTEKLLEQERELRQNSQELKIVQEKLNHQKRLMEMEIKSLKEQLSVVDKDHN